MSRHDFEIILSFFTTDTLINYHDDGTPSELKAVETFTSFIEVEDSSAIGVHKLIMNFIQQKGFNIKNCRRQGYDGAAVMSGKYSGLHKKIQDVAPHAYYVHCALHNLNLVLKDAMEAVTETRQFYDMSIYNFFGHSIMGRQKLQNIHNPYYSNPMLSVKSISLVWSIWCCLCFEGKIL